MARLDAAGSALPYATYIAGGQQDSGYGIAVDRAGKVYVTGFAASGDFPAKPDSFDPTYNGGFSDAFAVKLAAQEIRYDHSVCLSFVARNYSRHQVGGGQTSVQP